MPSRTCLLAGAISLAGGLLLAQVPQAERIPIRDPERLATLGFPRDATNVHAWSRAGLAEGLVMVGEEAEAWGTQVGYSTISGLEMKEEYSSDSYSGFYGIAVKRTSEGILCLGSSVSTEGGVPTFLVATIPVPEGASLGVFRYWAYDATAERDLTFQVYETCQSFDYDSPTTTLIAENSTIGAAGNYIGSRALGGITANNRDCSYSVRVGFAPAGQDCLGAALVVRKLQISWVRQVSPAPPAATFTDVPTSHPFFPFVEALVKSGVTGGCGSGNFCPDQPLTRGQMAVFLAKALGLQWP